MLSLRNSWLFAALLVLSPARILAGSPNEPVDVTYRTSASEVRLAFFTTDGKNHPVDVVSKEDFAVVDDDMIVRDFRSLMRSEETALDVVILVDTSGSIASRLHYVRKDVLSLIRQNPADSRVSVMSFSGLQPALLCSGDCGSAEATRKLMATQASGATPLYDALAYAAEFLADRHVRGARPVLLLFSDADDTISRTSARDALQAVIAAGALLYTVDLNVIGRPDKEKMEITRTAALRCGGWPRRPGADTFPLASKRPTHCKRRSTICALPMWSLTLCPAARSGSTHCEFFLDTIQPYSFIAVAVITTEPAFRNRRRMKRMFCLILSFLTLPAYAQHLGIYQHGTVVRMRMGECLPAIIV